MTSYSTYASGALKIVDGTLASTFRSEPDEENDDLQNDLYLLAHAVAAGAARVLLDTSNDIRDPEDANQSTQIHAEEWHSAAEGWELGALTDPSRELLEQRCLSFVTQNLADVVWLAQRLAFDARFKGEANGLWHHDMGMAFYRVGMLLGYEFGHHGIGFGDYWGADDDGFVEHHDGRTYRGITGRLDLWADKNGDYGFEDNWIDSTEEPCLLHLGSGN